LALVAAACSDSDLLSPGDPKLPYSAVAALVPDTLQSGDVVPALLITLTLTNQSTQPVNVPTDMCGGMITRLYTSMSTSSDTSVWESPLEACALVLMPPLSLQPGQSRQYIRRYLRSAISVPAGSYRVTVGAPQMDGQATLEAGTVTLP
jgi:hypothetical protein